MMKKKNKTYFYLMFALNSRPRKKKRNNSERKKNESEILPVQQNRVARADNLRAEQQPQRRREKYKKTEIKIWLFGGIKASLSAAWFL